MQDTLEKILSRVDTLLKEAKAANAIVIGFNSAAIFGILHLLDDSCFLNVIIFKWYVFNFVVCLFVGLVFSVFSFIPETRNNIPYSKTEIKNKNLLYFLELAAYNNVEELIRDLNIKTNKDAKKNLKIYDDYANQIIQNSRITSKKYKFFHRAIWLTIAGIITLPIGAAIFFFCDPSCERLRKKWKFSVSCF